MKQDPVRVGTIRDDATQEDNTGLVVLTSSVILTINKTLQRIRVPTGSQILHIFVDVTVPFNVGPIMIGTTPGGTDFCEPIQGDYMGRVEIPFTPKNLALMASTPAEVPGSLSSSIYAAVPDGSIGIAVVTILYVQKNNPEVTVPPKQNALGTLQAVDPPVRVPIPSPVFAPGSGGPQNPAPVPTFPPAPTPTPTPATPGGAGENPTPVNPTPVNPTPVNPTPIPGLPTPAPTPSPGGNGTQPYGQTGNWALTFEDHFLGNSLDTSKWTAKLWYEADNPRQNYAIENSLLKIWAVEPFTKENRTFTTSQKFEQKYGYFECFARLPVGRAVWPAFWLLGHPGDERPEIDIMEAYPGAPGGVWGDSNLHPLDFGMTVHEANSDGSRHNTLYASTFRTEGFAAVDLSADFHRYACKWEQSGVTFYFDGLQIGRYNETNGYFSQFQLYILLDLWLGSIAGDPNAGGVITGKGNSYEVDYVRAWQSGGGNPAPTPTPVTNPPTPFPTPSPTISPFPTPAPTPNGIFSANIVQAPLSGTTISGIVRFLVQGSMMVNVELLPASGYTPMYGRFEVINSGTQAVLDLNTNNLPNGPYTVRVAAFDQPAGVGTAQEITAMSSRTYTISNAGNGPTPVNPTPVNPTPVTPTQSPTPVIPQPTGSGPTGQNANDWILTFEDHFNSTQLNRSVWNTGLWYQDSTPGTWHIANGNLCLYANQPFQHSNVTIDTDPQGRDNTGGGFEQLYGFFEARIKMPRGHGYFPAFWLLRHSESNGWNNGYDRREIDIVECYCGGTSDWATGDKRPIDAAWTCHDPVDPQFSSGGNLISRRLSGTGFGNPDLHAGYHTYAVKWESDGLTFYFDGQQWGEKYFDTRWSAPMYIMCDMWLGWNGAGTTAGTADGSTPLGPGDHEMRIDYVRAWRRR